jgi:1-acyl-sn-glycerol-3-phosphate acyltransferase
VHVHIDVMTWEHVIVFYWVVKAIIGPLLRLVFRPWADGTENVPREGPAILASNHLSFSDHFFAPLPLPRKVVFLAKSEYFTGRGLKGLASRAFFRGVGQIPVDRSGGQASERALRTGLRVLAHGELLGIYPEGTRTPDGRLYRGKTGVARLALEAKVPVIPTAMVGTFEFQPPGKIAPRLWVRPGVRFGKPLDFSRYYGLHEDRIVLRAITDEIMYELMNLAGQEYVDEYAQRNKLRRGSSRRNPERGTPAGTADTGATIPATADGSLPASAGGSPLVTADGGAPATADGSMPATADGSSPATARGVGASADGGRPATVSGRPNSSASGVAGAAAGEGGASASAAAGSDEEAR